MIDDDEIIVDEELAEYFEKGDFSDLTFRTIYEKYSTWRIKEVFREAGYELKPVYLGYKALRYRECQRYWIIDMSNGQKWVHLITATALKTSVTFCVDLVFLFTVKITTPPEIRTADGLLVRSFLSL